MSVAAYMLGLCMIFTNVTSTPQEVHGCVPDTNWPRGLSTTGCFIFNDWDDNKQNDLVLTIPPGWPPAVYYDVMQYDDATNPYYRLWIEPKGVDVHWRDPCSTTLAEFKSMYTGR